jgi:hypothetical protein
MAGERITDTITAAEAQKDNVQHIDATISLLSRRLLYEAPTPEDELAGYSYLRGLTSHQDEIVQHAAGKALDLRWNKVGFYELHTPSKRFSFRENDRTHFEEAGLSRYGSGVDDDNKVAILELARRREPMTIGQLEDVITPLIGLRKDLPNLVDELKRLHVLTDDAQFVPVAETIQARLRMTDAAFEVLTPHLPVLEAISYPEQKMTEEEKQLALTVGKEIDRTITKATTFWTDENIQGLTMPQQPHFGFAFLSMLDFDLKQQKSGASRTQRKVDTISFVTDTQIYSLTHTNDPSSEFYKESINVNTYPNWEEKNQLLINFWGQQVGIRHIRQSGNLSIYNNARGSNYIEASGSFTSVLPEELQNASSATVSTEDMNINWNDVSKKGKEISLEVHFQKNQEEVTSKRFGRGETYVADKATYIRVPASSESKRPKRRKKTGDVDNEIDSGFIGSKTNKKEIALDKDIDSLEIMHPKGRYTLAYQKNESGIEITFTGRGWENKVVIPAQLNPVEVVRTLGEQLEGMTQSVSKDKEVIQQQVANIKYMGLVDYVYYNRFGTLPAEPVSDFFAESVKEFYADKERYPRLESIDKGLAALDSDTKYYLKYYMAVLGDMRRKRPFEEKTAREMDREISDPRLEFRQIIKRHNINIPEELLVLAEEEFMPEEYRNLPSETR